MDRHLIKNTTIAFGTLLVGSTLVCAASVPGTVTARDGKGMATVRTSDGKDHQVKLGDEFTVGTKVECEEKKNAMECRQVQAAVTPAPSPATPAPAPSAPTPAPAPAPSAPTAPAPSTSTPAPASK
jgi:hypothetical protein